MKAPTRLDKIGQDRWKRLFPLVQDMTEAKAETLSILCHQVSLYWRLDDVIKKQPLFVEFRGVSKPNPMLDAQRKAADMVLKYQTILGLDKVEVVEDELDEIDRVIGHDLEDK